MSIDTARNDELEHLQELERSERISDTRSGLLKHVAAGVRDLQEAAASLQQLRGSSVCDVEFAEGRDGRDVATFLDDSIRYARAAYAVVHAVIDRETP